MKGIHVDTPGQSICSFHAHLHVDKGLQLDTDTVYQECTQATHPSAERAHAMHTSAPG